MGTELQQLGERMGKMVKEHLEDVLKHGLSFEVAHLL